MVRHLEIVKINFDAQTLRMAQTLSRCQGIWAQILFNTQINCQPKNPSILPKRRPQHHLSSTFKSQQKYCFMQRKNKKKMKRQTRERKFSHFTLSTFKFVFMSLISIFTKALKRHLNKCSIKVWNKFCIWIFSPPIFSKDYAIVDWEVVMAKYASQSQRVHE